MFYPSGYYPSNNWNFVNSDNQFPPSYVNSPWPSIPMEQTMNASMEEAGVINHKNNCIKKKQPQVNDIEGEISNQNLYKTELCRTYEETKTCRYGNKCQFAHRKDELRPVIRHPKYKTEVCKTFYSQGTCPYGKRCRFIHTTDIENIRGKVSKDPETTVAPKSCVPSLAPMVPPVYPPMNHSASYNQIFRNNSGQNGTLNTSGGNIWNNYDKRRTYPSIEKDSKFNLFDNWSYAASTDQPFAHSELVPINSLELEDRSTTQTDLSFEEESQDEFSDDTARRLSFFQSLA